MAWLQLTTDLGKRDPGSVEPLFEELGAVAITLQDAGDNPLLEPAPGETPVWPTVVLTALFANNVTEELLRAALASEFTSDQLHFKQIADEDWQASFEQTLSPQQYGERLWVVPDQQTKIPEGCRSIVLAPGMAFGTGEHPTTAMCLEWLAGLDLAGKRVLDYGCGSGILGLAAAALGAAEVVMTDIDPQALLASRENAANNELEGVVQTTLPGEIEKSVPFDILLANILSGTLIELGSDLNSFMRPGSSMAITGILEDQAAQVTVAWSEWADMAVSMQVRQWVLLTGTKAITARKSETEG